jgi:CheY-like chemotaxis protein
MNFQMDADSAILSKSGVALCATSIVLPQTSHHNTFAQAILRIRPKAILLVEDEEFVRRLAREVLQSAGYIVVPAGSAAEALKACRKFCEPIDLLLADVVMPGMNGHDLAREFSNFYPEGEILLMSGYPEQLALSGLSKGQKKCLAKPFSVDVLLQRVQEILDV